MENNPAVHCRPTPLAPATDDQETLDDIDGRMHGPMSGYVEKHFGNIQYACQDASLEIQTPGGFTSHCAIPPAVPSPGNFLQLFSDYVSWELNGARGSWHISSGDISHVTAEDNSADGGSRLFLSMPSPPASNLQTRWGHVQVVGQFYRDNHVSYQDGLLRLCRSACQVFASQPTRLYLHGFYIRGSLLEFWTFDRSGLYCSDVFDLREDFIQPISVILSYQRMTDQALGKINFIENDEGGSYIVLDSAAMPSLGKLYLEDQPIASREGIVGSGTTCYRAKVPESSDWRYVLKFKWRWARERPEDELLKVAKEKGVWGAVSLEYYREVESTANLRRSLRWGKQRKFVREHVPEGQVTVEERQEVAGSVNGLAKYTEETDNFFQNRILACSLTSPVGRPLHTFWSLTELLQVFRDAIKCHRSLYYDAKILHQDISPGNMIILDDQDQGKPKGILIDLDSAEEISRQPATEPGITGTRPFIAIGVLKGEYHTYRHDLESFLYVFLWIVIANHTDNPSGTSKLRHWSNGDWNELAARKSLDMDQENFQDILEEFPPEFHTLKPLAEGLRRILFSLQDGTPYTGSDGSPEAVDELYVGMIRAFEEAIVSTSGV